MKPLSLISKTEHTAYHISGNNAVESTDITTHDEVPIILIKINSVEDGNLLIKIPYEFAKIPSSNHFYFPEVDGDYDRNYKEELSDFRTTFLLIPFKKENSEIAIVVGYNLSTGCGSSLSALKIQLACGFNNEQVTCRNGYEKIFKASNNFPKCVKPETAEKLVQRGWGKLVEKLPENTIKVKGTDFTVNYEISGGKLLGIEADIESKSMLISIKATEDGKLTITMPIVLLDVMTKSQDDSFFVLIDREEVDIIAEERTSANETLTINFPNGAEKIELFVATPLG